MFGEGKGIDHALVITSYPCSVLSLQSFVDIITRHADVRDRYAHPCI